MHISLASSRANGFRYWSDMHRQGSNDDDTPGGATPIAVTEPPSDDREAVQEPPHQPWNVPGTGTSLAGSSRG